MMEITMARGDLVKRTFVVKGVDKNPYVDPFDNIYFTVKRLANDKNYKFQKRLSDGGIMSLGDGEYEFTIQPEDTDNLEFPADYEFDIELVIEGEIKQTFYGVLHLTKEVTHHYNEVSKP